MEFYEFVIQLPNDFGDNSESFLEAYNREVDLESQVSDWDTSKVDPFLYNLTFAVVNQILEWGYALKDDFKYFIQWEEGEEYNHLHCCVESNVCKSYVLGRYTNKLKRALKGLLENKTEKEDFLTITKTSCKSNTKNKVNNENYILYYLLGKTQPAAVWAWSNIDKWQSALLSNSEREKLKADFVLQHGPPDKNTNKANPKIDTPTAERYMELIDWLVEKGITTEKQWLLEDRVSFRSHQAGQGTARHIKEALKAAAQEILLTKCARDYLVTGQDFSNIKENRIYKIMHLNGYDPHMAAAIFAKWCNREYGKRNTIWLFGPATTGKTNIAEAIAHAVPFYGCVNWTNESFPFNDCINKLIIWWEEGKMTAKTVETAKAILGGSKVRVDQKCRGSEELEPTPVIITSNTNMCYVIDGNTTTYEHQKPLEERMFKFNLVQKLAPDFGKISKQEVREFFTWGTTYDGVPESQFMVPTHHLLKRESTAPPSGQEPEAKRSKSDTTVRSFTRQPGEWLKNLGEDPHLSTYRKWKEERESRQEEPKTEFNYAIKCANHSHLKTVMYKCKNCELANKNINLCLPHGKENCAECFPQ